mgnify:CR=1 FL=1
MPLAGCRLWCRNLKGIGLRFHEPPWLADPRHWPLHESLSELAWPDPAAMAQLDWADQPVRWLTAWAWLCRELDDAQALAVVVHVLQRLDVPAVFFVNTHPIASTSVTTVHKIHLLRSQMPTAAFVPLVDRMAAAIGLTLSVAVSDELARARLEVDPLEREGALPAPWGRGRRGARAACVATPRCP